MENLNEIIVTGAGIEKEKRDSGCRAWSSFDLHSMSAALLSIFSAIGASRSVGASREFSPTVNRSHSSFGDRPTERDASNIRIIRLRYSGTNLFHSCVLLIVSIIREFKMNEKLEIIWFNIEKKEIFNRVLKHDILIDWKIDSEEWHWTIFQTKF